MVYERKGPKGTRYAVKIKVRGEQQWVGTFAGRREAEREERRARVEAEKRRGKDRTCDEYAAWWPDNRRRATRASTTRQHREALKKFAADFTGVTLRDVTTAQADRWARDNRWRVPSVSAMFTDARREELADINPFWNLGLDAREDRVSDAEQTGDGVLTVEEVVRLADCALEVHGPHRGSELRAMILFAAYTGCRWGECCALTWEDVDLGEGEVWVSKTLSNGTEVLPPKNGESRRIALPEIAAEALRSMPRQFDAKYVFTAPNGRFYSKSQWHYWWHPVRVRFGDPKLRFHGLRHFCGSWLADIIKMDPYKVARQLGHRDAEITLRRYRHEYKEKMLGEIKDALRRPPADPTELTDHRERTADEQ